jgi:DNA-binding MarR family transcriptional regulator
VSTRGELPAEGKTRREDAELEPRHFRELAEFRYQIRRFLSFSEAAAREAGIEPQQHQMLLALKGLPVGTRPNVGALAGRLCVKHQTAVALVDHLVTRKLVRREASPTDGREVLVVLTPAGEKLLRKLSSQHQRQLKTVGPELVHALRAIIEGRGSTLG